MPNEIHHHNGVLPSTTPATLSESQPGPRWFSTSGSLANSAGGSASFTPEDPAYAISAIKARLSHVASELVLSHGCHRRNDRRLRHSFPKIPWCSAGYHSNPTSAFWYC